MHYKRLTQIIIPVICSFFLFSCSSALYVPENTDAKGGVTLEELKSGRKDYLKKCANCHNLHLPAEYTKSQWEYWIDKMSVKAKLTLEEKMSIFYYVTSGK